MHELEFYAASGVMTELGPHADELRGVGNDVARIAEIVQGLLLHIAWAPHYGVDQAGREDEVQRRSAIEILDQARAIDDRPLLEEREPSRRALGNCRHFSTLATALLRAAGHPARARCGFGCYFEEGKRVDHWVVEYRDGDEWKLADAQLDTFQCEALSIAFDPLDVPRDQFLVAGEGWRRIRAGNDDGNRYGIFDMWGPWFIESNLARDLASLNKVELLPWDSWGVMLSGNSVHHEHDALLDEVADATVTANFDVVRGLYANELLRVPDVITAMYPEPAEVRIF